MPFYTLAKLAASELREEARREERRPRAMMAIHHDQHTVIDSVTGKRYALPAEAAWRKYEELNNA